MLIYGVQSRKMLLVINHGIKPGMAVYWRMELTWRHGNNSLPFSLFLLLVILLLLLLLLILLLPLFLLLLLLLSSSFFFFFFFFFYRP
jgi:hypothetical protein